MGQAYASVARRHANPCDLVHASRRSWRDPRGRLAYVGRVIRTQGGTPAERIRAFVALQLPPALIEEVVAWQRSALAGRNSLRPVPAESLHLTLAFLGSREPRRGAARGGGAGGARGPSGGAAAGASCGALPASAAERARPRRGEPRCDRRAGRSSCRHWSDRGLVGAEGGGGPSGRISASPGCVAAATRAAVIPPGPGCATRPSSPRARPHIRSVPSGSLSTVPNSGPRALATAPWPIRLAAATRRTEVI